MSEDELEALRFPVGRFAPSGSRDAESVRADLEALERFPELLDTQLERMRVQQGWEDRGYRAGSWTGADIVRHLADSHLNGYVRTMMALTDPDYTVQPYDQNGWAEQPLSDVPVDESATLLRTLHRRWAALLRAVPPERFDEEFQHPEWGGLTIRTLVELYVWHGRHHLGHLNLIAEAEG